MKTITKRTNILFALIALFLCGCIILSVSYVKYSSVWASNKANKHIYSNGTLISAGKILDRNGVILAQTINGKRQFASGSNLRKSVLHIVGDTSGYISTGSHWIYRDYLFGYDLINGMYNLKKNGEGNNLILNIDSDACRKAYEALGNYNGCIAAYNYKTGELLVSVSKPTYDVNNVPKDLQTNSNYDGVFLDKTVSGKYTPGSIMKIITAACAIENIPDIYEKKFVCSGKFDTGDGTVICNGVHGEVTFQKALNESCNCAFAEIAIELGAAKLQATAESCGFNKSLIANDIPLVKSTFYPDTVSKSELGWAGIGQSTTYVNPVHFLSILGAIANNGVGLAPERIKQAQGITILKSTLPQTLVTLEPQISSALSSLLRSDVKDKYGDWNFPGLDMCAKTGTAQIDGKKSHSWFAGYCLNEDFPIAVICIAEHAGYGSGVAMSAANKTLQSLKNNYCI